jgi:hypothetical protein
MQGESSERFLYTVNAAQAHERTSIFAGHKLASELQTRNQAQERTGREIKRGEDRTRNQAQERTGREIKRRRG